MTGPLQMIQELLREIWRARWLAVGVAWGVSLVLGVTVFMMKDRYEASARVYIDTQSVLKPLMVGLAFQPDIDQQIRMLARTLISRPNMELLRNSKDIGWDPVDPKKQEQEIQDLTKAIKMGPGGGGNNVYAISYRDTDPQRAQRLVERLVKMFVNSGGDGKKKDSEDARNFIEEEIRTYEAKLVEAENKLKDYKLKNFSVTGVSTQDYFARMSTLSDEVNRLRLETSAAEQSRDALKRELSSEAPQLPLEALGPQTAASPLVSEHEARLDTLKKQLDELLRRYTEEHPDVVSTRRTIAQVEALKRQDLEARRAALAALSKGGPNAVAAAATNPVFQKIRFALAEAEANVASLRVRLGTQQARLNETRALASRAPQTEAELTQLNRDYDIIRKNYEQLVSRRESASLGVKIDQSAPLAEFRIIEPPRTAQNPVFPNRLSLALLAVLAAMAAGIAAALIKSRIAPVVSSTKALRELTGRPVLGTVSLLVNEQGRQSQRLSLMGLLGAIASLMLVQAAWLGWVAVHSKI
jgi:polysaccharide chain length determinant protein (PEP-CTERM system associated)